MISTKDMKKKIYITELIINNININNNNNNNNSIVVFEMIYIFF